MVALPYTLLMTNLVKLIFHYGTFKIHSDPHSVFFAMQPA
jgi:hypothetical protein